MENDEITVLIASGWSETAKTWQPFLKKLSQFYQKNIAISHPRHGGELLEDFVEFPQEERRKACTILKNMESKKIGKVNVIAHSEGCINVLLAASQHPELFHHIILINPAGLVGIHSIFKLFFRFFCEILYSRLLSLDEKPIRSMWYFVSESLSYIFQNPIRAFQEAYGISKSDTKKLVNTLLKQGLKISLIYGANDQIFPAHLIEQNILKIAFTQKIKVAQGKHFDICMYPQKYISLIQEILHCMPSEKNISV